MSHQYLCNAAERAIGAVNSDTLVGREETLASLESLKEYLEVLIEALKAGT